MTIPVSPARTFQVAKNDYSKAAALYALGFPLLGGGGVERVDLDSHTSHAVEEDAWCFGERSAHGHQLGAVLQAWLSPVPTSLQRPLSPPELLRCLLHNRRMLVLAAKQGLPLYQCHLLCPVGPAMTLLSTYPKPNYERVSSTLPSAAVACSSTDLVAIAVTLGLLLAGVTQVNGQQLCSLVPDTEHSPYTLPEIEARLHDESYMLAGGLSPLPLCCATLHNRVMLGRLSLKSGTLLLCKGLRQAVIPRRATKELQERAARHLNT